MVTNFAQGQALTYQVFVPTNTTQMTIRYCGYTHSIGEVLVDGQSQNYIDMPRNGSATEWAEATSSLNLNAGKHTVTLSLFSGSCSLSAIQFK